MADSAQILSDLKKGKFAPVYFLQGEEAFYIDEITRYIEENALPEQDRSFNQVILYGKEASIPDILNHASGFAMLSDRKVVIVKEAQSIDKLDTEQNTKMLEKYLTNPQPGTILVWNYKYKTLDKRKALYKLFEKHSVLMTTEKMYDNKLPGWSQEYAESKGYRLNPSAAHLLVDHVGSDMARLAGELGKVFINVPPGTDITEAHIQEYVGISKEYNVFELQKALGLKQADLAYRIVYFFASDPKNNPAIVAVNALYNYFSKVLMAAVSKDKSDDGLAQLLGVHRFFVKDYQAAMRNYPIAKLKHVMHTLLEADLACKGVGAAADDDQILKETVAKILA